MHPGPIGWGLSLYSNLFTLDYTETKVLPEEEAWDTGTGANQSAQEEFIWERVWIIGSGIPSPTAGKAFRGVEGEHPPHPRVQGEEGGVLGDQRPSLEREDHLPHHRSFRLIS